MSAREGHCFVHVLAYVCSIPQATNSFRTAPPWRAVACVGGSVGEAAVRGGEGAELGGRNSDTLTGAGMGAWMERNGDVSLSVSKPRKREMIEVTIPYSVYVMQDQRHKNRKRNVG